MANGAGTSSMNAVVKETRDVGVNGTFPLRFLNRRRAKIPLKPFGVARPAPTSRPTEHRTVTYPPGGCAPVV
jgi:hypothetical protein